MKTYRGIYLDIEESEYFYKKYGYTFYFSSLKYLEKFKNNVDNYIKENNLKLKDRYKINLDFSVMFMITFYKNIEKRGFRVYINKTRQRLSNFSIINNIELN